MPELNLLYVHSKSMGYGRYGSYLAEALDAEGIDVFDHMPGVDPEREAEAWENMWEGSRAGICKTVCWVSTPSHATGWYRGQRLVMSTMWEATILPEQFREQLHNFERIIVPSRHNVELFSEFHSNVQFVPLGVDPARWHYVPRRQPETTFRFLIGGSGSRKGTDLARKAFRLAFPPETRHKMAPYPVLVMKSPKGEDILGPDIELVAGRISDEDEVALYETAHCYLQPSRGEGFGLQPLQAIAQGIPTILTHAHGHESFAHLGYGVGYTMKPSDYFIFGHAGDWWEPNLDELVEMMRWVYENYDDACYFAQHSAETVARDWTWKNVARNFIQALGGRDALSESLTPPLEVVRPMVRQFRVITLRDYVCDMGGIMRRFIGGKEYWESADVKRVLFEVGVLDPECLRLDIDQSLTDIGMAEVQAGAIHRYSAAHEYCETCGQQLNTKSTRADAIFAELEAEAMT